MRTELASPAERPPRHPQLHVLTDPSLPRADLIAALRLSAENGADWIHVRDPGAMALALFELAQSVVAACRPLGARIAVNDRVDVALAVQADAVQLGARSLPVSVARALVGSMAIGRSVH